VNFAEIKTQSIQGHELLMWTPQFAVLRNDEGQEITLRKDGRMIVRKVSSELDAKRAAEQILKIVLNKFTM
jgi:hypothetical protein